MRSVAINHALHVSFRLDLDLDEPVDKLVRDTYGQPALMARRTGRPAAGLWPKRASG